MKICENCKGEGKFILFDDREFSCPYCDGSGKIDWVDEVIPNLDHKSRMFERRILSFILNKYIGDPINELIFFKISQDLEYLVKKQIIKKYHYEKKSDRKHIFVYLNSIDGKDEVLEVTI